ncbi:profilin-1 isoform X1 [Alosa pseudoharengus]|uniref:profilin-1 isoform X1 n=1 Tax=Alosa pseudoharengus TaxID=34774 RepID=UPI003F88874A
MSWDGYIHTLMGNNEVMAAAILGSEAGKEQVWASTPLFAAITVAEIKAMVDFNRSGLFSQGIFLAGVKCTVLRDNLLTDAVWTMDMRTKITDTDSNTYSICVAKTAKALIVVQAKKDVHGGKVNKIAFDMAEYLRKSGY